MVEKRGPYRLDRPYRDNPLPQDVHLDLGNNGRSWVITSGNSSDRRYYHPAPGPRPSDDRVVEGWGPSESKPVGELTSTPPFEVRHVSLMNQEAPHPERG